MNKKTLVFIIFLILSSFVFAGDWVRPKDSSGNTSNGTFVLKDSVNDVDYVLRRTQDSIYEPSVFDFSYTPTGFTDAISGVGGSGAYAIYDGSLDLGDVPRYELTGEYTIEFILIMHDEIYSINGNNIIGIDDGGLLISIGKDDFYQIKSNVISLEYNLTSPLNAGAIYHVVFVQRWDGGSPSETELYINGQSQGIIANTDNYTSRAGNLILGMSLGLRKFHIDELAIYNISMANGEIDEHFLAFDNADDTYQDSVMTAPNLRHYWKFDNDFTDSVGSYDGTLSTTQYVDASASFRSSSGTGAVTLKTNKLELTTPEIRYGYNPYGGQFLTLNSMSDFEYGTLTGFAGWNTRAFDNWLFQALYSASGSDSGMVFTANAIPGITNGDVVFKANDQEALRLNGADQSMYVSGYTGIGDWAEIDNRLTIFSGDNQQNILKGKYNGDEKFTIRNDGTIITPTDLHINISDGGTLVLDQPVWDDVRITLSSSKLSGVNDPDFNIFISPTKVYEFQNNVDASEDEVYFTFQMPHKYKLGSLFEAHIHSSPDANGSAKVVFNLNCTKADVNGYFVSVNQNTTVYYTQDQNKHIYTDFNTLYSCQDISCIMECRFKRDSSHSIDNYTSGVFVHDVDFHYQVNTLGSVEENSK